MLSLSLSHVYLSGFCPSSDKGTYICSVQARGIGIPLFCLLLYSSPFCTNNTTTGIDNLKRRPKSLLLSALIDKGWKGPLPLVWAVITKAKVQKMQICDPISIFPTSSKWRKSSFRGFSKLYVSVLSPVINSIPKTEKRQILVLGTSLLLVYLQGTRTS